MSSAITPPGGEILFYQTDVGESRLQVRLDAETVWLSQRDMAEPFQTTPQNITTHIAGVYDEGEVSQAATCKEYLQVRMEGKRQVERSVKHYNLDVIISVGYRVKSLRGTEFRIWATQRLREYIVKGFTMDDERLKQGGGGNYFEELLALCCSPESKSAAVGLRFGQGGGIRLDILLRVPGSLHRFQMEYRLPEEFLRCPRAEKKAGLGRPDR